MIPRKRITKKKATPKKAPLSQTRRVLGAKYWPLPPKPGGQPTKSSAKSSAVARRVTGSAGRSTSSRSSAAIGGLLSAGPAPSQEPGVAPPSAPAAPTAPSGTNYTPEQEAADQISQEYGPKIAALLRQKSTIGIEHGALTGATQQYGAGFDNKLQEIYDKLRQQLQEGYATTSNSYTQAEGAVTGAHQAAGSAIQAAGNEAQGQVQGVADKLGLGAAMGGPQNRLQQFLSLAQTQNTQDQSQSLANLGANKAGALNFAQGGINAAAGEGASARAELVKQVAGQLGNLNLTKLRSESEIAGQLSSLESEKAAALRTLVQKIKESREESEREAAKEEFARQIQQNTMDIQLAKLGLARDKQEFDQGMDMQEFGLDQAKFGASQQQAYDRMGLTARGQDLAHQDRVAGLNLQKQKAGISTTKKSSWKSGYRPTTVKAPTKANIKSMSAQAKKKAQSNVASRVRKHANKGTQEAFFAILADNPTVRTAEVALSNTTDKYLRSKGISRKTLETWIRSYYQYT